MSVIHSLSYFPQHNSMFSQMAVFPLSSLLNNTPLHTYTTSSQPIHSLTDT